MRTLKYVIGVVSFSLLLVFACRKNVKVELNTDNSISAIQVLEKGGDITATLKSLIIGTTTDANGNYSISFTLPAGAKVEDLVIVYTVNQKAKVITDVTNTKYQLTTPALVEVQSESGTKRKYYVIISIEVVKASTKQITSFRFTKADNTSLSEDKVATISEATKTITLTLPNGTLVKSLKPTIEHDGISVNPQSGVAQDFTTIVDYEVTAQDGTKQTYTVTVTATGSPAKSITSFKFTKTDNSALLEEKVGTISEATKTITVDLPFGTAVASLKPAIEHEGKSIKPQSGVVQDFTDAVGYEVTAEDGTKQTYTVRVNVALSPVKSITSFKFTKTDNSALPEDQVATIYETSKTITLTLPFGTDAKSLKPSIEHGGKSIKPPNGVAQNFAPTDYVVESGDQQVLFTVLKYIQYEVTAEDGTTQSYNLSIKIVRHFDNSIDNFQFTKADNPTFPTDYKETSVIEETTKTITVTVPFGTERNGLVPTIAYVGKSINPASKTKQDFTQPVTYTVTAHNNSQAIYTVIVTVEEN